MISSLFTAAWRHWSQSTPLRYRSNPMSEDNQYIREQGRLRCAVFCFVVLWINVPRFTRRATDLYAWQHVRIYTWLLWRAALACHVLSFEPGTRMTLVKEPTVSAILRCHLVVSTLLVAVLRRAAWNCVVLWFARVTTVVNARQEHTRTYGRDLAWGVFGVEPRTHDTWKKMKAASRAHTYCKHLDVTMPPPPLETQPVEPGVPSPCLDRFAGKRYKSREC